MRKIIYLCFLYFVCVCTSEAFAARAISDKKNKIADNNAACLPFDMPSNDIILNADKKVFAHYFNRFPLSMDNKHSITDYYMTQYFDPHGENNKWRFQGGYLRSRPLPVPPKASSNYKVENLKIEVRLAIARGINGFTFNILSLKDLDKDSYLDNLLAAAISVDPRFTIVLMPDMSALKKDIKAIKTIVDQMYDTEGLYRDKEGRLVISPFLTESVKPDEWSRLFKQLEKEGKPIAFIPTFLSAKSEYVTNYLPISEGFGTFGTPIPGQGKAQKDTINKIREGGKSYMAGISPQGYRPKSFVFWESKGSQAYRENWEAIIASKADSVQLTTWNDVGESTQIIPYTDNYGSSGTGFYNLTGYYASWYLTGKKPQITRDAIYYFYRKQTATAPTENLDQKLKSFHYYIEGEDKIDIVVFLTAPATLNMSLGGATLSRDFGAGMHNVSFPLMPGTPSFSLTRNNQNIIDFTSNTPIYANKGLPTGHGDMTYWSGSATTKGTCFTNNILAK